MRMREGNQLSWDNHPPLFVKDAATRFVHAYKWAGLLAAIRVLASITNDLRRFLTI